MNLSIAYIRSCYAVPAFRGGRVEYEGRLGTIISARGPYLKVNLDGDKFALVYHPHDLRYVASLAPKGAAMIDTDRRGADDDER